MDTRGSSYTKSTVSLMFCIFKNQSETVILGFVSCTISGYESYVNPGTLEVCITVIPLVLVKVNGALKKSWPL